MTTHHNAPGRLVAVASAAAPLLMLAGAAIAVPWGLTLNPADTAATLAAVRDHVVPHLVELALDVLGWLALTVAALATAARAAAAGRYAALIPAGLLALAGAAGLLHDAGNLAVTRLAADPADPVAAAVAEAVLLTAKWTVNLAGLLWTAATATALRCIDLPVRFRRFGSAAALSGLAAVALPWAAGLETPTAAVESLGYALHLPVMAWWCVLGLRRGGLGTATLGGSSSAGTGSRVIREGGAARA